MRRLYLELKNQRYYFIVPPFILFILVPLVVLTSIKGNGSNFPECATLSQLFIPGFAAWWPIFILKEYHHSPGKELLYVYKDKKDSLFIKMIILWALFALQVLIVFIYFTTLFDFVWFLFIAIIIESMFMVALGYFLSMLFQNTFIPLIINFAYSSIFTLSVYNSPLSIFKINSFDNINSLSKYLVVAIIAFILLYGGYLIEKDLYKNSI
ncbi:MAG: ABC-2 family transporter permease [Bacillota bacterium]